jgi:site-specific DNA recombinase
MKRAAAYLRFSTDRQSTDTLADQESVCRKWAEAHGFNVAPEHVFRDAGQSGATLHRPGLQRMLAEAKGAGWGAVLVADQSRISRDTEDTLRLIRELGDLNIELWDCTSNINLSDENAELLAVVNGWQFKAFRRMVGHKTRGALTREASAGRSTGGRCFGYSTATVTVDSMPRKVRVIDDAEAAVVRRIFADCAEGAALKAIAHQLNAEGIAAPYDRPGLAYRKETGGRGWGHTTVRNILRNETYLGRIRWGARKFVKVQGTGTRRVGLLRPESEQVLREVPELAIVDNELWARVQARLALRKQSGAPRLKGGAKPSPLSLLLRCGHCGGRMCIQGRSHGRRGFGCTTAYSKGTCPSKALLLEAKALGMLGDVLRLSLEVMHGGDPENGGNGGAFAGFLEVERKARGTPKKKADPDLAAFDRAVRDAEGKARKVGELMLAQGHSATLATMLRDAEERVIDAKARREAADPSTHDEGSEPVAYTAEQLREVWKDLGKLFSGLADLDPVLAREELAKLFDSVTVTPRTGPEGTTWQLETDFRLHAPEELLPVLQGRGISGAVKRVAGAGFEPATFGL